MLLNLTVPSSVKNKPLTDYLENDLLVPRKVRHFLRTRKNVRVNKAVVPFHQEISGGDLLQLEFLDSDYDMPSVVLGKKENVDVLYEDDHLIIVNKPVGQKTHPNAPGETGTLQNDVAAYLAASKTFPYVVHRLDMETSGCVLFAKNLVVLPILGRMLEQRTIHRTYQAVVVGHFHQKELTIDQPIGRDRHDKRKRIVDERSGKQAITHIKVVKQQGNTSELLVSLETGRTHQIRVHLSALRHPIVGDPLYGTSSNRGSRLMLHAVSLELTHPFTGEKIKAVALPGLF